MGKVLRICAVVLVIVLAAGLSPADAQAQAQAQRAVRISLADGRQVDGYITGGDAINYFVQTPQGYFSIARAQVVAIDGQAVPPPSYPAAPTTPAAPPLQPEQQSSSRSHASNAMRVGGGVYLVTAVVALARMNDDDDAKYGLIPVAGPLVWTSKHDDDDFGEDGYDWLAIASSACQVAGFLGLFGRDAVKRNSIVHVTPVGARNYGGIAVTGGW